MSKNFYASFVNFWIKILTEHLMFKNEKIKKMIEKYSSIWDNFTML